MKIATIVGARPQFIKAAAVSRAIIEHNKVVNCDSDFISEVIIHTGQHYERNMSDVFFEEMQIPSPDYFFNINNLSHGAMTGQMLEKIEKVLQYEMPDMIMVYGDTNSTLAGALAGAKLHLPIAHVEAGLRSHNRRMPEEINRILTDHISSYLFCPTIKAVENLKVEGIVDSIPRCQEAAIGPMLKRKVSLVGDTMLDAALFFHQSAKKPRFFLPRKFILATIHREENTDDPERLKSIFHAFELISRDISIILPLHPRTCEKIERKKSAFKFQDSSIKLVKPLSYFEMIYLIDRCLLVMTDSGGLQKEAFFLKKPCITLRNETEWVELVENGCNLLAGFETENIHNAYHIFKKKKCNFNTKIYGEGNASQKILNILLQKMVE